MLVKFNKHFRNEDYEILFNTHTGFEILQGVNGKEDPFSLELPSLLDIGIMGRCKNKCVTCYQGHINEPNMTLKDFKRIIDEIKHHTNQVALGGRGDPNNHQNFKEIVEYSRKNKVVPNYTTSGINLTKEQVEISKLCGAVAVSDYDENFTYEAIRKLIKSGIKTNIHLIFSTQTFDRCLKILYGYNPWKYRISHGSYKNHFNLSKLNAVVFLLFKPQGAGKSYHDLVPNTYQLSVFSERIFSSKSKFKIGMDSCLVNHTTKFSKSLTSFQEKCIDTCEAARMSAYITPDMFLMPCSFADKNAWAISLRERTIKDVWQNSEQFKKFRQRLRKNPNSCPLGF